MTPEQDQFILALWTLVDKYSMPLQHHGESELTQLLATLQGFLGRQENKLHRLRDEAAILRLKSDDFMEM